MVSFPFAPSSVHEYGYNVLKSNVDTIKGLIETNIDRNNSVRELKLLLYCVFLFIYLYLIYL